MPKGRLSCRSERGTPKICPMRAFLVTLALSGLSSTAIAQQAPGDYQGVVPGSTHQPTHLNVSPGASPLSIAWPGFQPRADGTSRFFLETTSTPRWEVRKSGRTLTIVLQAAQIADGQQSMRPLETRFFSTPVTRAYLRRVRSEVHFVLEMRADVNPVITSETGANGFAFLFVSFPAGDYGVRSPVVTPHDAADVAVPASVLAPAATSSTSAQRANTSQSARPRSTPTRATWTNRPSNTAATPPEQALPEAAAPDYVDNERPPSMDDTTQVEQ